MAKWKLSRQTFGNEEFSFNEGDEVTIGRGVNNALTLSSLVISRNHCVLNVQKNQLLITDLKSSNGVFVGTRRIPPNTPFSVKDTDIIGIGWSTGITLSKIQDDEKFVFKVCKETADKAVVKRITFQNETEFEEIEEQIANLENVLSENNIPSPTINIKQPLKRKMYVDDTCNKNETIESKCESALSNDNICIVLSDSDNDINTKQQEQLLKKPKLEAIFEEPQKQIDSCDFNIKTENDDLDFEAFDVKQEYLRNDDELITIDSDSDCESDHWYLRLSQNSPGKPFMKMPREKKVVEQPEENSYSQMEDDPIARFSDDEEIYIDDLITIPPAPPDDFDLPPAPKDKNYSIQDVENDHHHTDIIENIASKLSFDEFDGHQLESMDIQKQIETKSLPLNTEKETKKTLMIEPQVHLPRKKAHQVAPPENKSRCSKNDKKGKDSLKLHMSNTQKEERKKKLKEIAIKKKEDTIKKDDLKADLKNATKPVANVKITSSNRGAFLTDTVQVVKPMKRKEHKSKSEKDKTETTVEPVEIKSPETNNIEHEKKSSNKTEKKECKSESSGKKENKEKIDKSKRSKDKHSEKSESKDSNSNKTLNTSAIDTRVPLKSVKPLTDSDESFAGKPYSKVEPLPPEKPKKSVRFSECPPEIHYFEIQEGNRMKKTSSIKTNLVDNMRNMPIYSLEKITLMKILRWNPHWLEEQLKFKDPPPILGHSNPPLAVFQSFSHHNQYVQLIGDLLLMEIWECLSLAYKKIRNQINVLQMTIASLPPVPSQDCSFDLFNFSVEVSLPTSDLRLLPRVGDILHVIFGVENSGRFFFVHNVKCLPSPPTNRNSFYSISLQAVYTEKMKYLKPGELIKGISLASVHNELSLFEAMAYMAGSPLSEAILRPEPRHFVNNDNYFNINIQNKWTTVLNSSQQAAVRSAVSATLADQPRIQMVQGPPGTGKSSVICAIVMTYFYDSLGKLQPNRGKILICATSNAAVDELVIRLLNIRQSLPKQERFRMVRVGRAEAMNPRARDVSSQQLAQRDVARVNQEPVNAALDEEISRLDAKINMWKTMALDAEGKDPMRVAYCETRISEMNKRIFLLKGGGGRGGNDAPRPEQLLAAERRIVEGANVILTTLASAQNHKMRGLKRRIALCVVDEAGQAIEPEALIPLTLDVTRLTLIGDPQQLPGYICSPRAKKHGLGESLFSRLSSCTETWDANPVILLDQQYRMQPAIAEYPLRAFYGGRVRSVPPPRPALAVLPYVIVGISSGDKGQNASGANEMESWGVSRLTGALAGTLRPRALSLAVITPYNAHKDLIKKNLRQLLPASEPQVEVNTVDSFQGQERDVVVVSLARSQGVGFLTDAGRMNVMLTRARHALIICLNPHAVVKNYQWRTLLEDAQRRNLYRTLPYKMCQATCSSSNDEILKYVSTQ